MQVLNGYLTVLNSESLDLVFRALAVILFQIFVLNSANTSSSLTSSFDFCEAGNGGGGGGRWRGGTGVGGGEGGGGY